MCSLARAALIVTVARAEHLRRVRFFSDPPKGWNGVGCMSERSGGQRVKSASLHSS